MSRRHARYAQRQVLWRESALKRVRNCGKVPTGADGNQVAVKAQGGVAHYSGLQSCGSVWSCPCCAPKILNRRATDISRAAGGWHRAGNSVYMTTFTMPHDFGMKLAALLPTVADGFRSVIGHYRWRKLKRQVGIVGTIRSVEVTHGRNGWHPHLHVLVFIEDDPGAEGLAALGLHVRSGWERFVVKAGYRAPDVLHGVVIERCASAAEAGAYIAKTGQGRAVGNEVARGDLKNGRNGHRTPLEILEDFRQTGNAEDLALWREYERATKGHQRITWSKGLRALLLPGEDELTDEQIAAEDVGGEIVAVIPSPAWRRIVATPGLPAAVLDAAEHAGVTGITEVMARHGITLTEGGPSP